jgi:Cdc6-like AAA superfamily ATPase
MEQVDIKDRFKHYMKTRSIFINKNALTEAFDPENLPFREKQTDKIARVLAPVLKFEKHRNLFIYGMTTLCAAAPGKESTR